MDTYVPFTISDIFDIEHLDTKLHPLIINQNSAKSLILLRAIIGSADLVNNCSEHSFKQEIDYLSDYYSVSGTVFEKLKHYISPDLEFSDLSAFFSNPLILRKNKQFFSRLLHEYSNFFYYQDKESYTTAFIYIYRILEMISFSFPLIYASQTSDFKHTYGLLKEFYESNSGNQKGELGFFKSAVQIIFDTNPIVETSVDIDFSSLNEDIRKLFYNSLYSIINNQILHSDTRQYDKICINFLDVSSFIVTLRNRFFHLFNRGDRNLESYEIVDSDLFYSYINKPIISWISVIYVEIIKTLFSFTNNNS